MNGVPFFARGANLVPPDHFLPRVDSADWARLLDDAAAANMNMVRVWGGGAYLPDVFYDLADAEGIMVWQDFMFANAMVPGDSAFVASVAAEARDQVRRLRNHPSLALWCGNNEIAEAWGAWGWQDEYTPGRRTAVAAAYARIFQDVLPGAVRAHDPTTPYWPALTAHLLGARGGLVGATATTGACGTDGSPSGPTRGRCPASPASSASRRSPPPDAGGVRRSGAGQPRRPAACARTRSSPRASRP